MHSETSIPSFDNQNGCERTQEDIEPFITFQQAPLSSTFNANMASKYLPLLFFEDEKTSSKNSISTDDYSPNLKEILPSQSKENIRDKELTCDQQKIKLLNCDQVISSNGSEASFEMDVQDSRVVYENAGSTAKESFVKERFGLTSEEIRGKYRENPNKFKGMLQEYREYLDSYQDELEEVCRPMSSELKEISNLKKELRLPRSKRMIRSDDIEVYSDSKIQLFIN